MAPGERRPAHHLFAAVAVATAMALVACDDDTGVEVRSAGSTTTVAEVTVASTAAPATTATTGMTVPTVPATTPATAAPTTLSPPPTTAAVPACAGNLGPIPGGAVEVTEAPGDYDGDGAPDQLITYGLPSGGGITWRVRITFDDGVSSEIDLPDPAPAAARALGPVQVDASLGAGTGQADEGLVVVGAGAATVLVGVVGVGEDRCVFRYQDSGGAGLDLPVGATVLNASGLRCEGTAGSQFLVQLSATSADGSTFTTEDVKLRRNGVMLVPDVTIPGSLVLPVDSAQLAGYSTIDCGGITPP